MVIAILFSGIIGFALASAVTGLLRTESPRWLFLFLLTVSPAVGVFSPLAWRALPGLMDVASLFMCPPGFDELTARMHCTGPEGAVIVSDTAGVIAATSPVVAISGLVLVAAALARLLPRPAWRDNLRTAGGVAVFVTVLSTAVVLTWPQVTLHIAGPVNRILYPHRGSSYTTFETPLVTIAATADPAGLARALDSSIRIDVRGKRGRTPLIAAVEGGRAGNAHLLLERGADPRLLDAVGRSALDYALERVADGEWDFVDLVEAMRAAR